MEVLFAVASSFGLMLIPTCIVGMLESGFAFGEMAIGSLLLCGVCGILCAISTYLKNRNGFLLKTCYK